MMMPGVLRFGALRQARIEFDLGEHRAGHDDIAARARERDDLARVRRGHFDDRFCGLHRNQRFIEAFRIE